MIGPFHDVTHAVWNTAEVSPRITARAADANSAVRIAKQKQELRGDSCGWRPGPPATRSGREEFHTAGRDLHRRAIAQRAAHDR